MYFYKSVLHALTSELDFVIRVILREYVFQETKDYLLS